MSGYFLPFSMPVYPGALEFKMDHYGPRRTPSVRTLKSERKSVEVVRLNAPMTGAVTGVTEDYLGTQQRRVHTRHYGNSNLNRMGQP